MAETPSLFARRWASNSRGNENACGIIQHAIVEFVARYRVGNRAQRLHETSRFVREGGRWYYLDGEFPDRGARP